MKRKKNGFTFVELMAIIVVIGIVLVLVVPSLIGNMGEAKEQTEIVFVKNIDKQINTFISKYKNEFKVDTENKYSFAGTDVYKVTKSDGNNYTFNDLKDKGIIEDFVNPKDSSITCVLSTDVELYRDSNFKYYYRYNLGCISQRGNFSDITSGSGESGTPEGGSGSGESEGNQGTGEGTGDNNNTITNIPNDDGTSQVIKKDNSNANAPDLNTNLVPVRYNGTNWVVIDPKETQWYDYDKQEWANAVSLKDNSKKAVGTELNDDTDIYAFFVWIPRYSYTIGCLNSTTNCLGYKIDGASDLSKDTPGAIDIKFIETDFNEELGDGITRPSYNYDNSSMNVINYMTHPAFNYGDKKLSGIWFGKFETTGEDTEPTILPDQTALTEQTIGGQFSTAQLFSTNDTYSINGDSHMSKNSEWSAVAYLSQSKYGKYGNQKYDGVNREIYTNDSAVQGTSSFSSTKQYKPGKTGRSACRITNSIVESGTYTYNDSLVTETTTKQDNCGTGASTTGNIYGIYDMAGGSYDRVMGNYNDNGMTNYSGSKYIENLESKDYDKFTSSATNNLELSEGIGQALGETINWYNASNSIGSFRTTTPWLVRGGSIANTKKVTSIFDVEGVVAGYYSGGSPEYYNYAFRVTLVNQ